jgi:hypothetical protein
MSGQAGVLVIKQPPTMGQTMLAFTSTLKFNMSEIMMSDLRSSGSRITGSGSEMIIDVKLTRTIPISECICHFCIMNSKYAQNISNFGYSHTLSKHIQFRILASLTYSLKPYPIADIHSRFEGIQATADETIWHTRSNHIQFRIPIKVFRRPRTRLWRRAIWRRPPGASPRLL